MKKIFKLALCSLMIVGCQSNEPKIIQREKNNQDISINFLTGALSQSELEYMNSIMKDFHKEYPDINIAYEGYQQNQKTTKTIADVIEERLKNNEAMDVACMDVKNIFDFVNEGKLVDLNDVPLSQEMIDIAKKDSMVNGKVYSVPASMVAYCMVSNQDMLKTCGLSIPNNWDEFLHCCEVLKKKGYQPIVGTRKFMKLIIYAGGLSQIYLSDQRDEYIEKLNSGEMKISEFARPGFEMLQTLIDKGYLDTKEALKYKAIDLMKIYNTQKGCFAFTYSSLLDPKQLDFELGLSGIPMKEGTIALAASDRRMSIFTNSQHIEECKKFVNYFSDKDTQKKTVEMFGKFPAYKNANVKLDVHLKELNEVILHGNTMLIQDYNLKFEQWANLDDLCDDLLAGKTVDEQLDAFDKIQKDSLS